jgi:asparagine synthase (glutamine-hydrolysing)
MCGVLGILQRHSQGPDASVIEAASRVQAHRGPDGSAVRTILGECYALTLGHQRLAVIDLTQAADQPMVYGNEQGYVVFNGELYNYLELRDELARAGERFSTRSDTEVLLAALHAWGPSRALAAFNWMGAFAWFNREAEQLVLACDAGAEKPLYYYLDGEKLVFASEVKTLLTLLQKRFALDPDTIGRFIFQGLSDVGVGTFFKGIQRLEPGTWMVIEPRVDRLAFHTEVFNAPPYEHEVAAMALPDFVAELRRVFVDSVRLRLRSDVPVGVLLSGGLDSSSIAAAAQQLLGRSAAPRLLSVVSDDPRFDESRHIATMERHLGQSAHKITLRGDPLALVSELSTANWYNDAPVASMSALGHFRLMKCARELGLTVILSGQGADEILLGYRKFLGFYLQSLLRHGRWVKALSVLGGFLRSRTVLGQFQLSNAKRYVRALRVVSGRSSEAIAGEFLSGWQSVPLGLGHGSLAERQLLDVRCYSVPSLCHYEDRMSMAWGREIRLPFLDSRLIDMLIRAPDDYKIRDGWTKYALRKAMEPQLPPSICWRRDKQGFSNPQGEWLKRELRDEVREAFSSDGLLARKGILNSRNLLSMFERYCRQPPDGGLIWYREMFAPFSLELWMQRYEAWIA